MTTNDKKSISIIIVSLCLIVIFGVLTYNFPHGLETVTGSGKVGGFSIMFEEGVTEPQTTQILRDHDLDMEYEMNYNVDHYSDRYYLQVDKDERRTIKYELSGVDNWVESGHDIPKGDHYIVAVREEVIDDDDFIAILDEHDLQLKKFVWCYLDLCNNDIDYKTAKSIRKELEDEELIFLSALMVLMDKK